MTEKPPVPAEKTRLLDLLTLYLAESKSPKIVHGASACLVYVALATTGALIPAPFFLIAQTAFLSLLGLGLFLLVSAFWNWDA